jgi:hypothetical protein
VRLAKGKAVTRISVFLYPFALILAEGFFEEKGILEIIDKASNSEGELK